MITNEGYTESAKKRVENYHRDIHLEIVNFSEFNYFIENFKFCIKCAEKKLNSIIYWDFSFPIIIDDIINFVDIGNCKDCEQKYLRCQGCGTFIEMSHVEQHCLCEEKKYFILNEKNEIFVSLNVFALENPNQLKLFA